MRKRDNNKKEAIFRATKELLNEIGFAEISMSKIARRAGVSAATIYVYFDNKDDMLVKLYVDVKKKLAKAIDIAVTESLPIRRVVENAIRGYIRFIMDNRDDYLFLEQFANSPMLQNVCIEEAASAFLPLRAVIERGQREGFLRGVPENLIIAYCCLPAANMVKESLNGGFTITEETVKAVVDMSWDAIKKDPASV